MEQNNQIQVLIKSRIAYSILMDQWEDVISEMLDRTIEYIMGEESDYSAYRQQITMIQADETLDKSHSGDKQGYEEYDTNQFLKDWADQTANENQKTNIIATQQFLQKFYAE